LAIDAVHRHKRLFDLGYRLWVEKQTQTFFNEKQCTQKKVQKPHPTKPIPPADHFKKKKKKKRICLSVSQHKYVLLTVITIISY
jgi:hypothetical protein